MSHKPEPIQLSLVATGFNKEHIKELALSNGFKLKNQPCGKPELNPYVYEFATAIQREVESQYNNKLKSALADLHNAWLNTSPSDPIPNPENYL